ncbi:Amino acid/polyamine transporter I [Penicillium cf. griseofulvum]|uniref:Amino acid/polyamine transporter I n=1 Tax=Penicillium cf. griseofulvum TaxID=2972120 RepID=A0A9W9JMS1_9EURO|nr:Amino acid/polyamine transporter I [Penicillium cf. griseofulvum]KAJ5443201.1 Amino acid/polyamine transporter I [Penicillium cf. griseofulvum]
MFPRRRLGSRSSACELGPINAGPTPQTTPEAHQTEHALGFTDIYGSLTPRQISIISLYPPPCTRTYILTQACSHWIGDWNGLDGRYWKSIVHERRKLFSRNLTGKDIDLLQPAAIIISYTIVGFAVYLVLCALGEVGSWLPKPYTVADQAVRFCDPALGFSLSWIFWLKYAVVTPNQLTAAALVVSYWVDAERVNPGVWITVFLSVIVILNFINHRLPSRIEFYVSSFKLVVMLGLMILSTVIALGGGPDQDVKGFRYWSYPGGFGTHRHLDHGLLEKFYITCSTMSSATFAYIGSERSGIAHFPNIRKATSRAIQNTFYRIMVFHLLAITLIGMIVPQGSVSVAFSNPSSHEAAASAFVAALYLAGISILPDLLNGCILLFVLSIANYDLYLATKAMCDLAVKHRAPAFLSRTTRRGVPIYALAVCSSTATLAYLNVNQDSTVVFGYFVDMVTMLGLLTWISILITHISFVRARNAQGIPDKALAFRARFGLPGTCLALVLCLFISVAIVFDSFSFDSGVRRFDVKSFIASYISIPLYISLMVGYKLAVRSKHVDPKEADLWTDKIELGNERGEGHTERN